MQDVHVHCDIVQDVHVHCDIVQDVHVHCDQGEEAEYRMYMYTVTKGKRQSTGCTCTL